MATTGSVLDECKVDTVICEIPISFTRRRYGQSQWYCWVSYHNGCGWDALGDPWPKSRPSNREILQELERIGLYVGAMVKAKGMMESRKTKIDSIDKREDGTFRYWMEDGGVFGSEELTKR